MKIVLKIEADEDIFLSNPKFFNSTVGDSVHIVINAKNEKKLKKKLDSFFNDLYIEDWETRDPNSERVNEFKQVLNEFRERVISTTDFNTAIRKNNWEFRIEEAR